MIKTQEIKMKWPLNWICDMTLKMPLQGLHFLNWQTFQLEVVCNNYEHTKLQAS